MASAGLAGLTVATGGLLSACGGGGASDDVPGAFGLIMPLTGSSAAFGKDEVAATKLGVEQLIAEREQAKAKVEAKVEDSKADPRVGTQAFNKLTSISGVPIVVSGFSAVIYAMAPLAERSKVVLLSVGANDPRIATLGHYTVSFYPLAYVDLTALANYLVKERQKRRAALLSISNATGEFGAKVFTKVFEQAGGQVVASEKHEPEATDFTAQLTKIRAANPDVIHAQTLVDELPIIVRQIRQLGMDAQITTYTLGESEVLLQKAGRQAEGMLYTSFAPPYDEPKVAQFQKDLTRSLGRPPNAFPYCVYYYDAPWIVARCAEYLLERKQEYTGENVRAAITDVKTFQTPLLGKTEFDPDGLILKPVTIKQIKDGKFVAVDIIKPGSELLSTEQLQSVKSV